MKKIVFFAAILLAAACTQAEPNPVEEAITARLKETTPAIQEIYYQKLEVMDTVSLADEISYREKLFELKCDILQKKYNKFKSERKPKNAALVKEDLDKALKIKEGVSGLRDKLRDSLDNVLYYEYKFTATAKAENNKIQITDYYVFITPEMKVLKYAQDKRGMRNGIGDIIPGYMEILSNVGMDEE